ncbi:signal peptidase II [Caviibacter abscessus]|uniref:signal peptidase II n=1 Tax=Caviibacter abscessus TaxID=1766719 RepID=UPI00082DC6D0|nr:signal peptidase II [Caviibacter abscessus]
MKSKSKESGSSLTLYIIIIILLTLIDQLSKHIMYILSKGVQGYSLKIFGEFLRFTYVENHGGIFGVFQGHIKAFTFISTLLIIYFAMTELKNFGKYNSSTKLAASFLIAGAAGNMIDRFFRGYVIDMIDFRTIWSFVFNIADMYIHIGVYILIFIYIFKKGEFRK